MGMGGLEFYVRVNSMLIQGATRLPGAAADMESARTKRRKGFRRLPAMRELGDPNSRIAGSRRWARAGGLTR